MRPASPAARATQNQPEDAGMVPREGGYETKAACPYAERWVSLTSLPEMTSRLVRRPRLLALLAAAAATVTLPFADPAQAQGMREMDLDASYPCAAHLTLADKQNLAEYANATKNDPCMTTNSREELDDLARSLAETAADIDRRMKAEADAAASDPGTAASDGSNVLDALTAQGEAIAQFRCQITGTVMFGMMNMGGRPDRPQTVTLTITDTGAAVINGTAIRPSETSPKVLGLNSPLDAALYPLLEVRRAMTGSFEDAPSTGLTADETRQLRSFGNFADGLIDSMTEGRDRRMVVMLGQNRIGFLDIAPGNRVTNAKTATCSRTM